MTKKTFAAAVGFLLWNVMAGVVDAFHSPNVLVLWQPIRLHPTTTTVLYSNNNNGGPPRRPRRSLQKRRKRVRETTFVTQPTTNSNNRDNNDDDFPWDTAESRPLIKAEAQEAGEDYWIAEEDLQKLQQAQAQARPRRLEGQVTDEKLWTEVLSPYRQNWIGLASVLVVVLAVIITQFPELLQSPIITIPDL